MPIILLVRRRDFSDLDSRRKKNAHCRLSAGFLIGQEVVTMVTCGAAGQKDVFPISLLLGDWKNTSL